MSDFCIATFNMNLGKGDWDHLLDAEKPDIILAQESHDPNSQLRKLFDEHAGHTIWREIPNSRRGSSIYFRHAELTEVPLSDFQGQALVAETDSVPWSSKPDLPLRIVCIHAGKADKGGYAARVDAILNLIRELQPGGDLIIGGDFNLTISERHPDEPRSTAQKDLEIQARLRDQFGLMNCWQAANEGKYLAQTLRWTRSPETPYHCDGLFVPESWRERLLSCDVLPGEQWTHLSDHLPVVAKFRTSPS
ncbi:MAG: endonuclease/exonuclease/phosphatase family protein [Pirellulaceae bacterium]|nr:endonuclease/exonuclease/phosphatase family protein [Pirellulaceae bacterium]